jgi:formyl-CoA transferase
MSSPAYYTRYGGRQPARVGAEHATIAPYGPYRCAEGHVVVLAVQNEREWRSFCETVLDDPSLADDLRFASNSARVAHRDELNAVISDRISGLPFEAAVALLDKAGVANSSLNSVAEFIDHPVLTGRQRWRSIATPAGPLESLLPPVGLRGVEPVMGAVPALGADTDAILRWLGRTDAAIDALRVRGVV